MNGTPVPISRTVVPLLSFSLRVIFRTLSVVVPAIGGSFPGYEGATGGSLPPSPVRFLRFFVGQIESINTNNLPRMPWIMFRSHILYPCLDKKDGDEQNSKLAQTPVPVYRNIVLYNVTSHFRIL